MGEDSIVFINTFYSLPVSLDPEYGCGSELFRGAAALSEAIAFTHLPPGGIALDKEIDLDEFRFPLGCD